MKSILQDKKECFITHQTEGLQKYYIYGEGNRQTCKNNGFWVWLLPRYYNESRDGVMYNSRLSDSIKRACQRAYESRHSRSEFVQLIGVSYL